MKMLITATSATSAVTTTTGARFDKINVKHAVKEFIKNKALPNALESKRGYIAVSAAHSGQCYVISKGGPVNAAWVKRMALEKGADCIWCGEIYGRMVAVIK